MQTPAIQFTLGLLAYAAQRGIEPERICRLAHIDPSWPAAANKAPLTEKQLNDCWTALLQVSNDPLFGLHFGESLQLSALGIVGELIKSSATIGDAVTVAAELGELVTGWFRFAITKEAGSFTIHIIAAKEDWATSIAATQTLDALMVLVIHELDGLLLRKIKPLQVYYAQPVSQAAEYERVFRCMPHIGENGNAISFDVKYWNDAIITANYELQEFLQQKMRALMETVNNSEKFSDKINRFLIGNAYMGILTLEETAANFNISPRTLQRRLRDEQVSFQQLAEHARQYLAVQALKQGVYAVKEIAYMLGYNELSAFSRAFKRWTGTSPNNFRAQLKN